MICMFSGNDKMYEFQQFCTSLHDSLDVINYLEIRNSTHFSFLFSYLLFIGIEIFELFFNNGRR